MAITKEQYVKALTDAGIPLTGEEKIADLRALATRHNIDVAEPAEDSGGSVAYVYDKDGGLVRTYSRDQHGDTFKEHAEEKVQQHPGGRVVVR